MVVETPCLHDNTHCKSFSHVYTHYGNELFLGTQKRAEQLPHINQGHHSMTAQLNNEIKKRTKQVRTTILTHYESKTGRKRQANIHNGLTLTRTLLVRTF